MDFTTPSFYFFVFQAHLNFYLFEYCRELYYQIAVSAMSHLFTSSMNVVEIIILYICR